MKSNGISDYFKMPDMPENFIGYRSPIELIANEIQMKVEKDFVIACQSYGFNIDAEELKKALAYDRDQYDKGYKDGFANGIDEGKRIAFQAFEESLFGRYGKDKE